MMNYEIFYEDYEMFYSCLPQIHHVHYIRTNLYGQVNLDLYTRAILSHYHFIQGVVLNSAYSDKIMVTSTTECYITPDPHVSHTPL